MPDLSIAQPVSPKARPLMSRLALDDRISRTLIVRQVRPKVRQNFASILNSLFQAHVACHGRYSQNLYFGLQGQNQRDDIV